MAGKDVQTQHDPQSPQADVCVLQPRGETQCRPQEMRWSSPLVIQNDATASSKERRENDASDLSDLKDLVEFSNNFCAPVLRNADAAFWNVFFVCNAATHLHSVFISCPLVQLAAIFAPCSPSSPGPGLLRSRVSVIMSLCL